MPNLIEVQKSSYDHFLQIGVSAENRTDAIAPLGPSTRASAVPLDAATRKRVLDGVDARIGSTYVSEKLARAMQFDLRARRNQVSPEVGRLKQAGRDAEAEVLIREMRELGERMAAEEKRRNEAEENVRALLLEIPNLPQLEPGSTVEVKFDPKRPERVYPAVPWARIWLFGG